VGKAVALRRLHLLAFSCKPILYVLVNGFKDFGTETNSLAYSSLSAATVIIAKC
jgi:hypothetical protein